jgi:hypothetical protein
MAQEAAVLYYEAAEILMKTDKTVAKVCIKKSVAIYCDMGKFDVAGRLERRMAHTEFHMGHWEDAAAHYRKSANFLAGEMLLDQSDLCIDKAAECYINMHELAKASKMFVMMAEGCKESNLRRFNAKSKLFMSILCELAITMEFEAVTLSQALDWKGDPRVRDKEEEEEEMKKATLVEFQRVEKIKYDEILSKVKNYEEIDYMWANCKEQLFIKNIIRFRLTYDKHEFADHLYHWNMVRPFDRIQLRLIRVVMDELQGELDRRTEEYRLDNLRKEKQRVKREKIEKQKKIMKEMGIKGHAVVDDEEIEMEAKKRQAHEDAIKAHAEKDVAIHGLEDGDDHALDDEAGNDEEEEDEGKPQQVEVDEPKERKRRGGGKAKDHK